MVKWLGLSAFPQATRRSQKEKECFKYLVYLVSGETKELLTFSCFIFKQNLCTFISAASKCAQLQYLWKSRDSGAVSALTWSLASYTCAGKNKPLIGGVSLVGVGCLLGGVRYVIDP